jgi:Rrf2 family transcriptional regulator, iron-sulfur cluster assembly transcription factor
VRLELTRRGDYAVRAMLALASAPRRGPQSVTQISSAMHIPVGFLPRVMGHLVRAGLVTSTTGRRGGYALARPATRIDLLHVIEAVEGDSRRQTCVLRGGPCQRDGRCQVHDAFFGAQAALLERLAAVSLADLVGESTLPRSTELGTDVPVGTGRTALGHPRHLEQP